MWPVLDFLMWLFPGGGRAQIIYMAGFGLSSYQKLYGMVIENWLPELC